MMSRSRPVVAAILVVLASLGVVVSLAGWWVRSTLFETEAFMDVVETSLASEEVATFLSDVISEQVVAALDVERRIETGLEALEDYVDESLAGMLGLAGSMESSLGPFDFGRSGDLAASIARPVNRAIENGVDDLVRSDAFQQTLPDAVAYAHRGAVALVRGETASPDNVSLVDGEVRWDMLPLVARAIVYVLDTDALPPFVEPVEVPEGAYEQPRSDTLAILADALGNALPEGFGEVTVMTIDTLENWQATARAVDRAAYASMFLTGALALAALLLAVERRRTLLQLAFGSVVAVLVAGLLHRNALTAVDAVGGSRSQQAALDVLVDSVFSSLQSTAAVYVLIAGIVGVFAHLAGRPRWLTTLRDRERAGHLQAGRARNLNELVSANRDAFVGAGILIALGILWWSGISLGSVLFVAAALGGYVGYVISVVPPAQETALE